MLYRVLALMALVACGSTALAQTNKSIDDQKVCPIMTNKEVNAESSVVEYQGIKIRMCCDTCAERFKKYPEAYLDEKFIPQLNGLKVPERKITQTFCPVYPDRVITEKDPFVVYQGHKVYLFNKAALKKWQKNPEKYAKAKLLPQLAEPADPTLKEGDSSASSGDNKSDSDADDDDESNDGKEGAKRDKGGAGH